MDPFRTTAAGNPSRASAAADRSYCFVGISAIRSILVLGNTCDSARLTNLLEQDAYARSALLGMTCPR